MHDGNPKLHKELSVYLGIPMSVFGLIGNFIAILVWKSIIKKQEGSRKSAGIYLVALAVVDSFLLLTFLAYESVPELRPTITHNLNFVNFSCYFGYPMYFFFKIASSWMIVGVTVNRFIAVIYPYKAVSFNSIRVTTIIIMSTLFCSFIINIPHFFNLRPLVGNGTVRVHKTTYGNSNGAAMYDLWVHCMFLVLVPWITIVILNSIIIRKVIFKTRIQKHKKSSTIKVERQMTITLLVVTISFLVFLIWQCIAQCFWMFHYGIDDPKIWFDVSTAYAPARLGVVINSSMNFTFYCLSGSFFRKEMRKMLGCGGDDGYSLFSSTNTTFASDKMINSGYEDEVHEPHEPSKSVDSARYCDPVV